MKATSLDDYLDGFLHSKTPQQASRNVREAYTYGVPGMITKSMTDRLAQSGHYTFHIGTPDPEMRRIASWMLTHENNRTTMQNLFQKYGSVVVVKISNLSDSFLQICRMKNWVKMVDVFLQLVQERVSVEVFLETAEEFLRGGRNSRMTLGFGCSCSESNLVTTDDIAPVT